MLIQSSQATTTTSSISLLSQSSSLMHPQWWPSSPSTMRQQCKPLPSVLIEPACLASQAPPTPVAIGMPSVAPMTTSLLTKSARPSPMYSYQTSVTSPPSHPSSSCADASNFFPTSVQIKGCYDTWQDIVVTKISNGGSTNAYAFILIHTHTSL